MENEQKKNGLDSANAITILRRLKSLCKDHLKMKEKFSSLEQMFTDRAILRNRQILKYEVEKLSAFSQFRREAFEIFWKYHVYDPIDFYKLFEEPDEEDQVMLKKFISNAITEISNFLTRFPDMKFMLLLNLGDLYRYSFILCGREQRDFDVSTQCYQKALIAEPDSGRPYNQLALLAREVEAEEDALFLFLRSLTQPKDCSQALKNFRLMEKTTFKQQKYQSFFEFAIISMFEFRRLDFENARKKFDDSLATIPVADLISFAQFVHMYSMAAIFAFRNEPTDEQFRYIASFLCQKINFLLEETQKKMAEREEEGQMRKRRRQRKSSSSSNSSDDEEESDANDTWAVAISAAEFLFLSGEHFSTRKLSVSLKIQFQNLLKAFVDLLNELLRSLSPLMHSIDSNPASKALLSDWMLGKLFTNEKSTVDWAKVLAHYLQNCINSRRIGIVFDKYFQLTSTTNGDKESLQFVDNISRLHSTHVNELNERTSKIPVYVAPDHLVFFNNLALLEKLIASSRQTIIVAHSVLAKIDKNKKENPKAREAIRWIQNHVATNRVRILQSSAREFVGECLKFLEEKKLLDKQTLFLSILTAEDEQKEYQAKEELTKYPVIGIETIGNFVERIFAYSLST